MSEQDHGTGDQALDPPLESEVTADVLGGGSGDQGAAPQEGTSPGSDGDGVEAGYTTPGELVEEPEPVEPTD